MSRIKHVSEMEIPLKDGDRFVDLQGRVQEVCGSIVTNPGFHVIPEREKTCNHKVCWTRRGEWFRRADGVEVTGAFRDEGGEPVTVQEALRRKNSCPAG